MSFIKEFKEFATRGNVMDLAVGVIMGAAFGNIITSLVDYVITPLLLAPSLEATGVENIENLVWGNVKYGLFFSAIIKFTLVAFILFVLVKSANKLMKKTEVIPPKGPTQEELLTEIRDLLKRK